MKKLLATIMALVLALTLVPAAWAGSSDNTAQNENVKETVYAAEVDAVKYETLEAAVEAVSDTAKTILLLTPTDLSSKLAISGKSVTLDLNGKTLTSEAGIELKNKAALTVKDSVGAGKIMLSKSSLSVNSSTLKIESGTIEINPKSTGSHTIAMFSDSNVEMIGGTVIAHKTACFNLGYFGTQSISVTGGTLICNDGATPVIGISRFASPQPYVTIEIGGSANVQMKPESGKANVLVSGAAESDKITVTGGTFDVDPSTYLAEGYKVTEETKDSAATYTVSIKTYTVTFNTLLGSKVNSQTVNHGNAIEAVTTTRDGYEFKGWYKDSGFNTKWDTTTGVTEDMTLYAKWEKLASADTDTKKEDTTTKTETVVDTSKNTATETVTETTKTNAVTVETKTETVIDTTTNTVKSTTETKTTETETAKTEVKTTSTGDTKTATAAVEVSNVKTEKVANAAVTIDATVAETNTNADVTTVEVTIPKTEAKKLEAAKTVEVKTDVGTLTIDSTALKTITDNGSSATDEKVTLTITDTTKTALPAVSGAAKSFQLTAKVGDNDKAFKDSKGTITVTVPMAAPGFRQQHVCYYNDNGKLSRMGGTGYKNGSFSWNTNHFSEFVVVTETVSTSRAYIDLNGSSSGTTVTTTTTTTTGKANSATTFDAGVGIYAATAILSVTGMAWVGKKKH